MVTNDHTSQSATQSTTSLPRTSSSEVPKKEANGETFTRYLATEAVNRHIRNALHENEATKEVGVIGVGTTKTGHVIRFQDQESTKKARANTECLQEH